MARTISRVDSCRQISSRGLAPFLSLISCARPPTACRTLQASDGLLHTKTHVKCCRSMLWNACRGWLQGDGFPDVCAVQLRSRSPAQSAYCGKVISQPLCSARPICSARPLCSASPVLTCRCSAALASSPAEEVDQAYAEGSSFLRGLGLDSRAEILRILDTAMNPNSLYRDSRRSDNYHVRADALLTAASHHAQQSAAWRPLLCMLTGPTAHCGGRHETCGCVPAIAWL